MDSPKGQHRRYGTGLPDTAVNIYRRPTKKDTEALQDTELSLYTFRQGETMTNGIYLEKYKGLIEHDEHYGGQPGLQEIRVQAKLDTLAADPAAPTDVETAQARVAACEEYLAVLLIRLSDPKRYLTLIVDRIPSTTPGAEPPRDVKDSGSARSHSTHLETSSSNRP